MKKREICIGGKFGKYFYCPESPYILWNHKLRYKECPIARKERNYDRCEDCELKEK